MENKVENTKHVSEIYSETIPEEVKVLAKKNGAISTMTVDLSSNNLPDLADADEVPFDLSSNYWTPVNPGEFKKVYFLEIKTRPVADSENKDVIKELPCAFFLEKNGAEMQTICNGSIRLVSCLENNAITRGTPLKITYLGKQKNSTNQFKSDSWKVQPLLINITNGAGTETAK